MTVMLQSNIRSRAITPHRSEIEPSSQPAGNPYSLLDKARMFDVEQRQRQLLEAALEDLPIGVAILDSRDLHLAWANRAGRQQLGLLSLRRSVIGAHLHDVLPGADESGLTTVIRKVAESGRPCAGLEYEVDLGLAGRRLVRFSLRPLADGERGTLSGRHLLLQVTSIGGRSKGPAGQPQQAGVGCEEDEAV